jgi:flagella basal body P-ring formation protein FlgA
MIRALLFAAAAALIAAPALAQTPVTLRAEPLDADGQVTLGDIFDGAGATGGMVVARRTGPSVVLDAGMVQIAARRAGLSWSNDQGLRRVIVRGGAPAVTTAASASAPTPAGGVEVLTWARSMNTGDVVQPQDLVWAKLAGAPADTPRDSDAVVGMEVRRPVRAGAAAGLRDVSAPMVIKQGDMIAVTWSEGGVNVTLQAKAMGAAAAGQMFSAQNLSSKKIVQAVAQGPGQAAIGPSAATLRLASR